MELYTSLDDELNNKYNMFTPDFSTSTQSTSSEGTATISIDQVSHTSETPSAMQDNSMSHQKSMKLQELTQDFQLEKPYSTQYGITYTIKTNKTHDTTIDLTCRLLADSEIEFNNPKKLVIELDFENITLLNTKLIQLRNKIASYMKLETNSEYLKSMFKVIKEEKIYLNLSLTKKQLDLKTNLKPGIYKMKLRFNQIFVSNENKYYVRYQFMKLL